MKKYIQILLVSILSATAINLKAQDSADPYENETQEQRDARMKWWREAKFGMFIHWGVYSVPAGTYKGKQIGGIGEWIMNSAKIPVAEYREFAKQFNPVKYNPDEWVKLAKEAGMKYIIITSKHHDGFALFDSKVTEWDVVDATPYKKDLLKPLSEACRKYGIKLGFYYSQEQAAHEAVEFENVFKNKNIPQEVIVHEFSEDSLSLAVILLRTKCCESLGAARRLIAQGGVRIDGEKISDINQILAFSANGVVIKAGKKSFIRVVKKTAK